MRVIFFLISFLFIFQAAQAESLVLSRSSKVGVIFADRLEKNGEKFFLNQKPVKASKYAAAKEYWKLARAIKSGADCGAGKFVIIHEEASQKTQTSGCAYGEEYGKLIAALYKLK